jgi:hypothetical protein
MTSLLEWRKNQHDRWRQRDQNYGARMSDKSKGNEARRVEIAAAVESGDAWRFGPLKGRTQQGWANRAVATPKPPPSKLKPGAPTDAGRFNRLATKGSTGPKGPQGPQGPRPLAEAPGLGARPELPGSPAYDNSGYLSELGKVRADLAAQQSRLEQGYKARLSEIQAMFNLAETDQERESLKFAQTDLTNQAAAAKAGIDAAWQQAAIQIDASQQRSGEVTDRTSDEVRDLYNEAAENIDAVAGSAGGGLEQDPMAEAIGLDGGAATERDLAIQAAADEAAYMKRMGDANAADFEWQRGAASRQQASQQGSLQNMSAQQAAALGLNHYQRVNDRIENDRRQMFQYQMDERNRSDSMSRALFDQLSGLDLQIAGERQRGVDRNFDLSNERANRQWELDYSDWGRQRDERDRYSQRERDAFQDFDIQSQLDQRSNSAMAEAMGALPPEGQAFLAQLRSTAKQGGFVSFDGSSIDAPMGEKDVAVSTAITNVEYAINTAMSSRAPDTRTLRFVLESEFSNMDENHKRAFMAKMGVYPTADAVLAKLGIRG